MLIRLLTVLLVAPAAALLPPIPPRTAVHPPLAPLQNRALAAGGAAAVSMLPQVASAVETAGGAELPNDAFVVGFALFLVVAAGALQLSLGDIVADEAQLPSSVNLINKNRQRRSNFIKGKDGS